MIKLVRKPLMAGLLACTVFASVLSPVFAAPLYKDTLGMAGMFPWTAAWKTSVDRTAAMGYTRGRMDFTWANIERTKGVYNFSFYDQVYSYMASKGMRPTFILVFNNSLYSGSTNNMAGVITQENRDAYARFCAAAVEHFKGKPIIWEVWNEPDLQNFWSTGPNVDLYTQLAQAAIKAIRAKDPNAFVTSAGFAHPYWTSSFIQQFIQKGGLAGFDALAVHSYDYLNPPMIPENQEAYNAKLRQLMSQYNGGKVLPILDTEFGTKNSWSQKVSSNPTDYSAKLNMRLHLDAYYDGMMASHLYGIDARDDWALTADSPTYKAANYLNNLLGNYEGTKVNVGAKARALLFRNTGGQQIMVAWPIEGSQTITFPSALNVSGATDVYGNSVRGAGSVSSYTGTVAQGPLVFMLNGGTTPPPPPPPNPDPTPEPPPPPPPNPNPNPNPPPSSGVPAAPTNLAQQNKLEKRRNYAVRWVKLTWKDNASNESGTEIWQSTSANGRYRIVKVLRGTATEWIGEISRQPMKSDVFYKVRAYNSKGPSAFSNTVRVPRF